MAGPVCLWSSRLLLGVGAYFILIGTSERLPTRTMADVWSGTIRESGVVEPGDCHSITFLSFLRSSSEQKREDGRMDTIEAGGGRSLRRRRSAQEQCKKMGARSKNEVARICQPDSLPPYPLLRCLERCRERRLVSAPPHDLPRC
jgi:hypothetical protein